MHPGCWQAGLGANCAPGLVAGWAGWGLGATPGLLARLAGWLGARCHTRAAGWLAGVGGCAPGLLAMCAPRLLAGCSQSGRQEILNFTKCNFYKQCAKSSSYMRGEIGCVVLCVEFGGLLVCDVFGVLVH